MMYLLRIAAWLSQGVNCILLGGHHDVTVSARLYLNRERGGKWGLAIEWSMPYFSGKPTTVVTLGCLTCFGQKKCCPGLTDRHTVFQAVHL